MFDGPGGRHRAITLAITCLGFFMVLLDVSIVNVALPTMQASLGADLSDLQWVIDGYTLPFAVLLLSAGTLGDRFGRKKLFLFGLAVFTAGSAMCGVATDLPFLIAGRALQGAGGAALAPGSLSLIVSAFADSRQRVQALGLWAGISGIAIAAGSIVGGVLVQAAGWPSIFMVNLPIGLAALLLGSRWLADSRSPIARRPDVAGQALAIGGLLALTYALIEGNVLGWGSPTIVALLAAAAAMLASFAVVEARTAEPMVPLTLFARPVIAGAIGSGVLTGFAMTGTVFFSSQYFQAIQGYSPLESGLRSLPVTLGLFVGAPFAGRIAARYGFRPPILGGALSAAAGLLLMTDIAPTTPYADLWWKLGLIGLGFGVLLSPLTAVVMTATPPAYAGLASSMTNAARQVGGVLGVALSGAIVERGFAVNLDAGLASLGVGRGQSALVSERLAHAGAQAVGLPPQALSLDVAPLALHALAATSFTDALHAAYFVAGASMVVVAAVVAVVLRPRTTAAEPASDAPAMAEAA